MLNSVRPATQGRPKVSREEFEARKAAAAAVADAAPQTQLAWLAGNQAAAAGVHEPDLARLAGAWPVLEARDAAVLLCSQHSSRAWGA